MTPTASIALDSVQVPIKKDIGAKHIDSYGRLSIDLARLISYQNSGPLQYDEKTDRGFSK